MVFTVGHSNKRLDEFIALIKAHDIELLIDVRSVPASRHNPQFNKATLPEILGQAGITYEHWPELGGFRKPKPDSRNTALKNAGFRGYADYMASPDFQKALDKLISVSGKQRTAVMCAEAVPWRCHRRLIADALTVRDVAVEHILGERRTSVHELAPEAKVESGLPVYSGPDSSDIGLNS